MSLMLERNCDLRVRRVNLVIEAIEALPLLGGDFFAHLAGIFARRVDAIGDRGGIDVIEDQLARHRFKRAVPLHSIRLAQRRHHALPARLRVGAAGVEHQAHGHVEQAHGILRALQVAAHPVEAVGNARKHLASLSSDPTVLESDLFQNPCVLAAAALRGVDHQRAFFERHAGQSAGHDVDFVAKENVGPQIHVARLKPVVDQAGRAREIERGLGDVVARVGLDLPRELLALPRPWSAGR